MTNSTESSCPKCGAPIPEGAPQGLCPKCVLGGAATLPDPTSSSGRRTPPPLVEELAPHFPDLEILELIGSGGMGAVYKARQSRLDRIVALKVLSHDLNDDPAFAERFDREARVLARLSHPNIVAIFDTGTAGPYAYLLMEYVDGVNLRQAMRTGGFTPAEALALVQDICSALKYAHEEGILHRDIKPENVLLDSRGQVKIADFGIAKLVGQKEGENITLTLEGSILGSPQYMAPEQIETPGDVDQRADIYSLGVVLYEMLTGELPLGRFALPSEKTAMDARIDEIVLRTLAKERGARFQSAGEVQTEVEAITRSPAKESTQRRSGRDVLHPEEIQRKTAGGDPERETARFATASAVLTGVSIPFGLVYAIPLISGFVVAAFQASEPRIGGVEAIVVLAIFLAIFGILPGLGFIFGVMALLDIRRTGGRKRGMGRALFGTLTWPMLFIVAAIGLVIFRTVDSTGLGFDIPGLAALALAIGGLLVTLLILATARWARAVPRGVPVHDPRG